MLDGVSEKDLVDALVNEHRELLRFVERRVGSRADAEDILQDAFVRGVQHAGSVRDGESSSAWFYRVLRNAIIDHHRRRAAAGRAYEAVAHELDEEVPPPDVQGVVCACVGKLARTLKPEYAAVIHHVDVEGRPLQELASEAGITPNNAAVRLHRAREALRKRVAETCGTCATHGCLDCSCGAATRV